MSGKAFTSTAIIAPPPTPNGDLHVGHLSGPYFGVDVLGRYLRLRGENVVAAIGVDLNQSYVVTTAERLGTDPNLLARQSHAEVTSTLNQAGIVFDVIGIPDPAYQAYVSSWFSRLFSAGLLQRRQRGVPYDPKRQRFMFESYASGRCTECLAETKGNICEACGHPNDPGQLFGLYPTGGKAGDPVEMREIVEYVLDLESWREPLIRHLRSTLPTLRPALERLINQLLAKPLPAFPITFPSGWGIPAPFPDADGLVLNVWAEMVPGHYHWLDLAHRNTGASSPLIALEQTARYVQFLGFDNSFFYAVAHLALALAARESGIEALLPNAIVTNEFYQLENYKFSTSQGHLIWGRDLLAEADLDDIRFYLAWSNPEYNQSNFSRSEFESVSAQKFRKPLEELIVSLEGVSRHSVHPAMPPLVRSLLQRFEAAYNFEQPSLRIAAATLCNGIELANHLVKSGENPSLIRAFALALAAGAAPLVPDSAHRIFEAAGGAGNIFWPAHDVENLPVLRSA
jgi:methionyl-tRNA synthetase